MRAFVVLALIAIVPAFAALSGCNDNNVDASWHASSSRSWSVLSEEAQFRHARIQQIASAVAPAPAASSTRGVVITVSSAVDVAAAYTAAAHLRTISSLPIQVVHQGAISAAAQADFESISNVAVVTNDAKAFVAQAIMDAPYGEIVAMDARTIALADPASLFESKEFTSTGLLFFPSLYKTAGSNPIWGMVGQACVDAHEQSAAVIVVNKAASWKVLNVATHLSSSFYRTMMNGNDNMFRMAALATSTPFTMSSIAARTAGAEYTIAGNTQFCAHMIVHSVNGADMFVVSANSLVQPANANVESLNCIANAPVTNDAAVLQAVVGIQFEVPESTIVPLVQCTTGGASFAQAQAIAIEQGRGVNLANWVKGSAQKITFQRVLSVGHPFCASTFGCVPLADQTSQIYLFVANISVGAAQSAHIVVTTENQYNNNLGNQTYLYVRDPSGQRVECDRRIFSLNAAETSINHDISTGSYALVYAAWEVAIAETLQDLVVTVRYTGDSNSASSIGASAFTVAIAALIAAIAQRL